MEIDHNRFINLVIEKTNKKLNELQAQIFVLEAQLQLAAEANQELKSQLDKINKKKDKSEFSTPG